jgi:hypothetical protein
MVIYHHIPIIIGLALCNILELNGKVLQVQQLPPLHLLNDVYFVFLEVFLRLVDALGEDAHRSVLLESIKSNSTHKGAAILRKWNGEAQSDKSYLF